MKTGKEETKMVAEKKVVEYTCNCCGEKFDSHRVRSGEKLCFDCVGLRRALKSFTKRGLSNVEVMKRGRKLLDVKK